MPLTLIHVPVSHFSEKARWALDYKRVDHVRRWPPGGFHPVATWLATSGRHQTVPVLLDAGEGIGDSTAIIRHLEERFPDPPLYPADPAERERALTLEDWFDEHLGPDIRRMGYHHLTTDPDGLSELTMHQLQYAHPAMLALTKRIVKLFLNARFSTGSRAEAEAAEERVVTAMDRLEAELNGRDYLVGGGFTVADLTAAALFYPLVLPPQTPWRPTRLPEPLRRLQAEQRDRPGYQWVAEIYRRHR